MTRRHPRPSMVALPRGFSPKMLICDIDGTLTDQNYAIHPAVPAALRRLEEIGIPVALATGNVRPITWGIARQLGISGPLISENGGVIWDWREDGDVVRLADGVRARAAAEWLATRMDGFDASGIESNAWRESEWCLHTSENDNEMRRLLGDSEWSDLSIVRTGFAIHLADQALHKGNGVARALVMRGIDAGDVVAVGDAPNDIPMFELVGFSAAVGNAFEATKSAADIIIDAPNGAAVAMLVDAIIEHIKNEK